ncbi:hypothetical protein EV359DRAFT_63554 [Lentinula novae-zelandiae]|nr:hypothetical protein EV359DRAFT_63554 [Lentinula novae-zelandiae]
MKLRAFKRIAKFIRPHRAKQSQYDSPTTYTTVPARGPKIQTNRPNDGPDESPFGTYALNGQDNTVSTIAPRPASPRVFDYGFPHLDSALQHGHPVPYPTEDLLALQQHSHVHIGGHVIFPVGPIDYLLRIEEATPGSGCNCLIPAGEMKVASPNLNIVLGPGRRVVLLIGSPTGEGKEYVAEVIKHYIVTTQQLEAGMRVRRNIAEAINIPNTQLPVGGDVGIHINIGEDQQVLQRPLGDSSRPATAISAQRVDNRKGKRRETAIIGSSSIGLPNSHAPLSPSMTDHPLLNTPERIREAQHLRDDLMRELSIQPPVAHTREMLGDTVTELRKVRPRVVEQAHSHHTPPPRSPPSALPSERNNSHPLYPPGLPHPILPVQLDRQTDAATNGHSSIPQYSTYSPNILYQTPGIDPLNASLHGASTSQRNSAIPQYVRERIEEFERARNLSEPAGYASMLAHRALQDSPSEIRPALSALDARNDPDMRPFDRASNWLRELPVNPKSFDDVFPTHAAHDPTGEADRVPEQWRHPVTHMVEIPVLHDYPVRARDAEDEGRSAYVTAITSLEEGRQHHPHAFTSAVPQPFTPEGRHYPSGEPKSTFAVKAVPQEYANTDQAQSPARLTPGQPLMDRIGRPLDDGESAYATAISHELFDEQGRLLNYLPAPVQKPQASQERLTALQAMEQFQLQEDREDREQFTPTPRAHFRPEPGQSSYATSNLNLDVPGTWRWSKDPSNPSNLVAVWPPESQGRSHPYQRPPLKFEVPRMQGRHPFNYSGPFQEIPLPSVSPNSQIFPMFAPDPLDSTDVPHSVDHTNSSRPMNPLAASPELPVTNASSPGFPALPSPFGHRGDLDVIVPSLSPLYGAHKSTPRPKDFNISFDGTAFDRKPNVVRTIPDAVHLDDLLDVDDKQGESSGQSASSSFPPTYPYYYFSPERRVSSPEEMSSSDIMLAQYGEQGNPEGFELSKPEFIEGSSKDSRYFVE